MYPYLQALLPSGLQKTVRKTVVNGIRRHRCPLPENVLRELKSFETELKNRSQYCTVSA